MNENLFMLVIFLNFTKLTNNTTASMHQQVLSKRICFMGYRVL